MYITSGSNKNHISITSYGQVSYPEIGDGNFNITHSHFID